MEQQHMPDKRKTKHCSLCSIAGNPEEIKAPAAHIQDEAAHGHFPGSDSARIAVYSYGLEYPSKVVCRDCYQTLLRVFSD